VRLRQRGIIRPLCCTGDKRGSFGLRRSDGGPHPKGGRQTVKDYFCPAWPAVAIQPRNSISLEIARFGAKMAWCAWYAGWGRRAVERVAQRLASMVALSSPPASVPEKGR